MGWSWTDVVIGGLIITILVWPAIVHFLLKLIDW